MLYQLVRTAGGIPGPLAVLFDRTPVEVAEEKVPTLRVAPTRAARAREPSMVAERYRRFMTGSREGVGFLITEGGWEEVAGRLRFWRSKSGTRRDTLDFVKKPTNIDFIVTIWSAELLRSLCQTFDREKAPITWSRQRYEVQQGPRLHGGQHNRRRLDNLQPGKPAGRS